MKPTPNPETVHGYLADLIRSRMNDWEIRQVDLAAVAGISQKHLSQMLTGKAQGSLATWQRLLDALPAFPEDEPWQFRRDERGSRPA